VAAPRKIRIELDEDGARALHAALTSALAADAERFAGARDVLAQLDRRVPDWTASDDPYDAVLDALASAEDEGRAALAAEELAVALGAGGASIGAVLDRMEREKLVQRTARDDRTWIAAAAAGRRRRGAREASEHAPLADADALVDLLYAERRPSRWAYRPAVQAIARLDDTAFEVLASELRRRRLLEPADGDDLALTDDGATLARERWAAGSSLPHWRIPAPPLPYRPLPVHVEPADRACPARGCDGEADWLKPKGRSAAFKALVRDGSVEWTCPSCSRKWLIYLQAVSDDGAPAYRDPVEGAYNRPRWRSGR
jgi:DNA-binding MarR family transcriptional regulator